MQGGELLSSLVRAQARVRAALIPANAHARLKTPAGDSTLFPSDFVFVLLLVGGEFLDSVQPGRWRHRRRQNSTAGVVSRVSCRKPLVRRKEGRKKGRRESGVFTVGECVWMPPGVHREVLAFVATTTTTALPNNCRSLCPVVLLCSLLCLACLFLRSR